MGVIEKTIQVAKKVTIGYECDGCGRKEEVADEKVPDSWHEFDRGHQAWGKDSIESYDYFVVCSPKCFLKKVEDEIPKLESHYGATIGDMSLEFAKHLIEYIKSLESARRHDGSKLF